MPVSSVFLLPGQGGYTPGLFADEYPSNPRIREILDTVDRVAAEFSRPGVTTLLTRTDAPDAAELVRQDPFALQLAVFAAGAGGCHLAERHGAPDVLVGHSMGEIAALTVAGAFDLPDGARLTAQRAEALAAHCPAGGMLALELSAARTAHLVGAVDEHGLALAVTNAPRQTVVSGPAQALAAVRKVASALDVQATPLNAPYPFHGPMLAVAAQRFAAAVTGIRQQPLRLRVFSPVAAGYVHDDTDLKALLVRQLTAPVDFLGAVRHLHADGAERFVECGRAGLSGLVRRTVPSVTTDSTASGAASVPRPPAESPAAVEPVPQPVTAPAAAPVTAPFVDAEEVLRELRELYASALEYPVEVITADADLEADLGIDSLKRAEMVAKVAAHFGLGESAQDGRFVAQSTLADLAGLVVSAQTHAR
ncbi:acyltransferase domain-containing protein [Streptomyces sp. NPDC047002]|uniref:acyltransferase domain-containing protein n=1 Tax=Streptomyces sp. NPDC047002 TaxID=3155475 RepID=UPI003456E32D